MRVGQEHLTPSISLILQICTATANPHSTRCWFGLVLACVRVVVRVQKRCRRRERVSSKTRRQGCRGGKVSERLRPTDDTPRGTLGHSHWPIQSCFFCSALLRPPPLRLRYRQAEWCCSLCCTHLLFSLPPLPCTFPTFCPSLFCLVTFCCYPLTFCNPPRVCHVWFYFFFLFFSAVESWPKNCFILRRSR